MSSARFILVILICASPFILLMDGTVIYGAVAGLAAAGIAVVARAMRPGETQFLISVIRPAAAVAAVPALWIVIQVIPLRVFAHPIWASAATALAQPLAGSISIDLGAGAMALGLYLSVIAIVLLSAAVAVDRQRASWILFTVMAATASIALILPFHDLAGLSFLRGVGATAARAQAVDCTATGAIVAAAVAIRTLERYENRRVDSLQASLFWPFAASLIALVICAASLAVSSTVAAMIATAYGLGALIAVAVIRRLGLGLWGIVAIAVSALGLAVLLIGSEPGLRTKGIALAFAAPSPPALTSLQRILEDTAWTGTGAGTFAAIMPIYRDINDPATSTAPTAAAALAIELGRPMFWLIVAVIMGAVVILLRASLLRGRDSFYPAAGAGCLLTLLLLAFMNTGILGTATAVIAAAMLGLALAQSKSRTI